MKIEDIIEIIEKNFKEYKGSNEAILHSAEEISDKIKDIIIETAQYVVSEPEFEDYTSISKKTASIILKDFIEKLKI